MPSQSASSLSLYQRIHACYAGQGLMQHLGVELHAVAPGQVTLRLPYRPELTQHHGYFHAGGTTAIADSAGGFAALTLFPENTSVLTVEFKINLLAPAEGEYLEAVGKVIKSGRTLTVGQAEVYAVRADQRTLVALVQQTFFCVPNRA